MSTVRFDGHNHTIELLDEHNTSLGKWPAYNNIDSKFAKEHYGSQRHLQDGTYTIIDQEAPGYKPADANGSYGLYGIIHFNYPGHPGVGIHSGRASDRKAPGPQHATHGCVRTTDSAMLKIKEVMAKDPLKTIVIFGNSAVSIKHGNAKLRVNAGSPNSSAAVKA